MATRNIAQGDLIFKEPPLTAGASCVIRSKVHLEKKGLGSTQHQCALGVTDQPHFSGQGTVLIKSYLIGNRCVQMFKMSVARVRA